MRVSSSQTLARNIRRHALLMTSQGGSPHIGSALSVADILAVLYSGILKVRPSQPDWSGRDRFILSKGHAACALYAVLAEVGFFRKNVLKTFYRDGSLLSGHVSRRGVNGVELSTGSLGHGLSVGAGICYSGKMSEKKFRVFVLLGDGECDEGSVWEAILFSAHHQLENLVAIVDYNKIQSLASVNETLKLEPFLKKWKSFGWNVAEVDGHSHKGLREALSHIPRKRGKPSCLIAHTVKGKGVSFMEHSVLWHYRMASGQALKAALKEIENP